jgi:RimJ/RimL family protein N-acetyltransferase
MGTVIRLFRIAGLAAVAGALTRGNSNSLSGMTHSEIRTPRLILRCWRPEDRAPFAALNADPAVMEHFPSTLSRTESDALADRIESHFAKHGFGLWAVEIHGVAPFAGFIGLSVPAFETHFTPCVEVGWRLARAHWGKGYATEGASATLRFGFERLGLNEIVSFTVPANTPSRRVMERIGVRHSPADDFDHPSLPAGHPMQRHVLYRLTKADWAASVDS